MIKGGLAANGVRKEAGRRGREAAVHRHLRRPARLDPVGGHFRQREGCGPGLAEGRGRAAAGTRRRPGRGRQTFKEYVEERWLPNHVLEPTTREKYTYYLGAHIIPALGPMRMADIFPQHIREWVTKMQREGRSAWTIQYCKSSILNSIFTTALNDQVTYIHPCRGVKVPTVPATPRTIVAPEQFDAIYQALLDVDHRLLVETAIETGLRWGELTELRVKDLGFITRILTVCRKVTARPGRTPSK
jgi:integrase